MEGKPNPNILLAEDGEELRALIARTLRAQGYEVHECTSGGELLDALSPLFLDDRAVPHDLVITDVRMPGLTGLEILEGMSECSHAPPIILITAFGDEETHRLARSLGAITVLDKPFELEDLSRQVRSALDGRVAKRPDPVRP